MGKASIATAGRRSHTERASRHVLRDAQRNHPVAFGYLKLVILLAMIFVPWAVIIYVARIAMTAH